MSIELVMQNICMILLTCNYGRGKENYYMGKEREQNGCLAGVETNQKKKKQKTETKTEELHREISEQSNLQLARILGDTGQYFF